MEQRMHAQYIVCINAGNHWTTCCSWSLWPYILIDLSLMPCLACNRNKPLLHCVHPLHYLLLSCCTATHPSFPPLPLVAVKCLYQQACLHSQTTVILWLSRSKIYFLILTLMTHIRAPEIYMLNVLLKTLRDHSRNKQRQLRKTIKETKQILFINVI